MDRDKVLRIMAALRAKFSEESGCTPEEAESAMIRYNEMMQRYNVDETELHIKQEGIGESVYGYATGKHKHEVYWCLTAIGKLTNTKPIATPRLKEVTFIGTQADRDYAEFLFRLCWNAIETSWKAYRFSFSYTKLHRQGIHGRKIRYSFRTAMASRLSQRMQMLARENAVEATTTTNALVLVKDALINTYIENEYGKINKGKTSKHRYSTADAAMAGKEAADDVKLRQEMGNRAKRLSYSGG